MNLKPVGIQFLIATAFGVGLLLVVLQKEWGDTFLTYFLPAFAMLFVYAWSIPGKDADGEAMSSVLIFEVFAVGLWAAYTLFGWVIPVVLFSYFVAHFSHWLTDENRRNNPDTKKKGE